MRIFWTDGSAEPNPGDGGWAVIEDDKPVALGSDKNTTNIRMEGTAILNALKLTDDRVEIYTDSEFWINVLTKWAPSWEQNGWRKKGGEIKNLDLVQELYKIYQQKQPKLTFTRGHIGTKQNELADEWANKARKGATI